MQNVKTQKILFVNTFVLTVLVQMSVFFSAFFVLGVFGISKFLRDVFGNHNSKITKYQSNKNKKTTTTKTKRKTKNIIL